MESITEAPSKKTQRNLSTAELHQLLERTRSEQTVSTAEAAAIIGLRPQTLRKWSCTGEGPIKPRRAFGRLRWAVADINAVLNASTP
jgi:hypothetical protein